MGQHKTTEMLCLNCGKTFQARNSDITRGTGGDFCSRSCKNNGRYNPNYKGGQLSNYEYKLRAMQKNPMRFLAMQTVQTAIRNGTFMRYYLYMNSEVATNNHKGFVSNKQVTASGKLSRKFPVKTTTEFAFAMEFRDSTTAFLAADKLGAIMFERKDIE